MSIIDRIIRRTDAYQELHNRYTALYNDDRFTALSSREIDSAGDYNSTIEALYSRYNRQTLVGSGPVRAIVDFRTTQIAGNGFAFKSTDPATNEWVVKYAEHNDLSGSRGWRIVRDGELEGHSILTNSVVKTRHGVSVRTRSLPQLKWRPEIILLSDDAETIDAVQFRDANDKIQTLRGDNVSFIRLAGATVNKINDKRNYVVTNTVPRAGMVLEHCDAISHAMNDLRTNNKLFGQPMLETSVQEVSILAVVREAIFGRGGDRVIVRGSEGRWYVHPASSRYIEPSGSANNAIIAEITMHAQLISGQTGIPVHYLGFPQLLSNRATADDMHELINATTSAEREAWKSGMEQNARKACALYMLATGADLQPDTIQVSLPVVMLSAIERLSTVWLTLYREGVISLQTLREQIPGIDPEREAMFDDSKKSQRENEDKNLIENIMRRVNEQDNSSVHTEHIN